jgi:hypothetical protein
MELKVCTMLTRLKLLTIRPTASRVDRQNLRSQSASQSASQPAR